MPPPLYTGWRRAGVHSCNKVKLSLHSGAFGWQAARRFVGWESSDCLFHFEECACPVSHLGWAASVGWGAFTLARVCLVSFSSQGERECSLSSSPRAKRGVAFNTFMWCFSGARRVLPISFCLLIYLWSCFGWLFMPIYEL